MLQRLRGVFVVLSRGDQLLSGGDYPIFYEGAILSFELCGNWGKAEEEE